MIANIDLDVATISNPNDHGLRDNTILIFTTDSTRTATRYLTHQMRAKGSPYEGGSLVPLVVSWPAGILGGYCDIPKHQPLTSMSCPPWRTCAQ